MSTLRLLSLFVLSLTLAGAVYATEPSKPSNAWAGPDTAPVSARFARPDGGPEPSFHRHVIPMMSKLGCSGRACHGSFQGAGNFRLSLFGYDFAADHRAITTGVGVSGKATPADKPRVDLKSPDDSLVLQKPTLQMKHKGGHVIAENSWQHHIIRRWIQAGAKDDSASQPKFAKLEVTPAEIIFRTPGEKVALRVLAHWADGRVEDVTQLTRFRTNDESVAAVDDLSVVTCVGKGDTHIVAFYDNGVLPIPVMLPVSDRVGPHPAVAARTRVDQLVSAKLRKAGIVPAEVCDDAEFLRRVSLDLAGTLPPPADVRAFLADTRLDKRDRKIDELLATPAYAAYWANKLCDFTGNNPRHLRLVTPNQGEGEASRQWYDWLYARVRDNMPYDEIVEGIVMATSRSSQDQDYLSFAKEMSGYFMAGDKKTDFTRRETMPHYWSRQNLQKSEDKALGFAHAFLGVQLQCASCHKHPFDQWTKQDFEQFQAFFEGIRFGLRKDADAGYKGLMAVLAVDKSSPNAQKEAQQKISAALAQGDPVAFKELYVERPREISEKEKARLLAVKKVDKGSGAQGRVITPKLLGGEPEEALGKYADPREPVMDWLRNNNPYFAKAFVNRVWANHFGRGIVEPADDLNLANPPSNAELFNHLAEGFVASGYDMRRLHRTILASDTYQRSWRTNATNVHDERNFSRASLRRLPAEVVVDAIAQSLAADDAFASAYTAVARRSFGPEPTANYQKGGAGSYALTVFGKPSRETTCDCERAGDPTLLQTLYLRNDPETLARIDTSAWIAQLRVAEKGQGGTPRKAEPSAPAPAKDKPGKLGKPVPAKAYIPRKPGEVQAKTEAVAPAPTVPAGAAPAPPPELAPARLIEQVFLRTLSRLPTADERRKAGEHYAASPSAVDATRDLLWVMLNTKEFVVNH